MASVSSPGASGIASLYTAEHEESLAILKRQIQDALNAANLPLLHKLLKKNYAFLNQALDKEGSTLLMLAAQSEHPQAKQVVQYLLNLGANLFQTNASDLTAIDLASMREKPEISALFERYIQQIDLYKDLLQEIQQKFSDSFKDLGTEESLGASESKSESESMSTERESLLAQLTNTTRNILMPLDSSSIRNLSLEDQEFSLQFMSRLHEILLEASRSPERDTPVAEEKLKTDLLKLIQEHSARIAGTSSDYLAGDNLGNQLSFNLARRLFPEENPWAIVWQDSLAQSPDRAEPWTHCETFENAPGPESIRRVYRVHDPRLLTQTDKTKIHVIDQILGQITPLTLATRTLESIWKGTDVKGNGIHAAPLTSYDLTLLRQRSATLNLLITHTEKLQESRLNPTKQQTIYEAFSTLSTGLAKGSAKANSAYEHNAGEAANVALINFKEKFWDTLPHPLQEKIRSIWIWKDNLSIPARGEKKTLGGILDLILSPVVGELPRDTRLEDPEAGPNAGGRGLAKYCLANIGALLNEILENSIIQGFLRDYEAERGQPERPEETTLSQTDLRLLVRETIKELDSSHIRPERKIIAEQSFETLCREFKTLEERVLLAVRTNNLAELHQSHQGFIFFDRLSSLKNLALLEAARLGHTAIIHELLLLGADINTQDATTGNSPLMEAVAHKKTAAIKDLLHAGAALNHRNLAGESATSLAAQFKCNELIPLFYDHGAAIADLPSHYASHFLRTELKSRKPRDFSRAQLLRAQQLFLKIEDRHLDKRLCQDLLALAVKKNNLVLFFMALGKKAIEKYDHPVYCPRPAGFNQWLCQRFTQADANTPEQVKTTLEILKKLRLDKAKILEIFQQEIREGALGDGARAIQARAALNSIVHKHPEDKTSLAARVFWKERLFTSKNIQKGTLLLAHNLIAPAAAPAAPAALATVSANQLKGVTND